MSCHKEYYLLLDSKNRSVGDYTNYKIDIPQAISKVRSVELLECTIPNTFYNVIDSVNDKIYIDEGLGTLIIQIPYGSYNATALETALQDTINISTVNTYTVTYAPTTFRYNIQTTNPFSLMFGTGGTQSIASLIGFNDEDYTGATYYNSVNMINLTKYTSLMIDIEELNNKPSYVNGFWSNFIINNDANSGSYIYHAAQGNHQIVNCQTPLTTNRLTVRLRDDSGSIIPSSELGMNWWFKINIICM
jgi:hypothetical protein